MAEATTAPDATLVSRMAARDQEALSSLYDRHKRILFAQALRILRDRAEAEEVLADVFLQAWRQAGGYDGSRGTVSGWLVNLCRSRAIDRLRARGRREAGAQAAVREEEVRAPSGADPSGGPEEHADLQMKKRRIQEALCALAQQQREALELAYYGGLSHSEIAEKLGQPLGTIKTRIRQGLITLREHLGAQFGAPEP
jgi:RNA polymerase sigma-70 factor, ECF subfamily